MAGDERLLLAVELVHGVRRRRAGHSEAGPGRALAPAHPQMRADPVWWVSATKVSSSRPLSTSKVRLGVDGGHRAEQLHRLVDQVAAEVAQASAAGRAGPRSGLNRSNRDSNRARRRATRRRSSRRSVRKSESQRRFW